LDSAEECFKLRQQLRDENDSFDESEVENRWGSFGNWELVGNGKVTNEHCGKYLRLDGCLRVDLHDRIKYAKVKVDGKEKVVRVAGKIYRYTVRHFCNKPSCCVCYKSGWALRQAGRIEARLKEASKRFGQVEHLMISVPAKDYGLSFDVLREKINEILLSRGVIGGSVIFHGCRFNDLTRHWYYSPHFHILGFILGGYSKCRHCERKWNCLKGCGGFDDRNHQSFLKDGYKVKVFEERKTVFGSAYYELGHATIDVTKKRFHVVTWFGVCSFRKLKVTVEMRKKLCPACKHECGPIRYLDVKPLSSEREAFDDAFDSNGCMLWAEDTRKGWRQR